MTVRKVALPYGRDKVEFTVPDRNLIGIYSPREVAPVNDVKAEIRRALAAPIGAPPLQKQVRGKKNVVLIADDNTRLTPTDVLIPILLDECNAAGVPDSAITVIIALGTHRPMTDDEIMVKFGAETLHRVPSGTILIRIRTPLWIWERPETGDAF